MRMTPSKCPTFDHFFKYPILTFIRNLKKSCAVISKNDVFLTDDKRYE